MTDVPERIWAKERHDSWGAYGHWYSDARGGGIPYIRADLVQNNPKDEVTLQNERTNE